MKIRADLGICTGHARCETLAGAVYATDDVEGKVVARFEIVPTALQQEALRGAKACPERALTIVDDAGDILWPPRQQRG